MAMYAFCWRLIFNMNLSIYNVIRDGGTTNLYHVKLDGPFPSRWLYDWNVNIGGLWRWYPRRWNRHDRLLHAGGLHTPFHYWQCGDGLRDYQRSTIIDYFTWTSNINFHWITCCHSTGWEPLGSSTRAATRLPATWAFMIRSSTKAILSNSFIALNFSSNLWKVWFAISDSNH